MSNIDLFHQFAGKTFAILYDHFPMFKAISEEDLVQGADLDGMEPSHAREVAGYTLMWLLETGYLRRSGETVPPRLTLSPKGFEVLDASPFPIRETDTPPAPRAEERTLGNQLKALTKETLTSEAKEQLKSLVHRAFGWGIALALAKAHTL
jgi:hypothetical protein